MTGPAKALARALVIYDLWIQCARFGIATYRHGVLIGTPRALGIVAVKYVRVVWVELAIRKFLRTTIAIRKCNSIAREGIRLPGIIVHNPMQVMAGPLLSERVRVDT